ncbi:hypothetical protein VOLCADRAFT_85830 [Volvox carteri f. nagariensis]|uniref:Uncharacterized protein n=1 Tax=Volvox carteri f. nagariensis TaxID=3068 RepID=D8TH39_VOLCA|nr:uncharacterized protein VOLCADRAFT_85830 [Volvox carteri f. nagariensis]EFJ52644.1 hypothetical protein VOLCADRAFT_85830 [Volvox carteri f. nagariensis]|eukprot:XP_002945649.1 hypothetical protein VOLCADRAFT_85830 [Volvox carteri f. nagariensis]
MLLIPLPVSRIAAAARLRETVTAGGTFETASAAEMAMQPAPPQPPPHAYITLRRRPHHNTTEYGTTKPCSRRIHIRMGLHTQLCRWLPALVPWSVAIEIETTETIATTVTAIGPHRALRALMRIANGGLPEGIEIGIELEIATGTRLDPVIAAGRGTGKRIGRGRGNVSEATAELDRYRGRVRARPAVDHHSRSVVAAAVAGRRRRRGTDGGSVACRRYSGSGVCLGRGRGCHVETHEEAAVVAAAARVESTTIRSSSSVPTRGSLAPAMVHGMGADASGAPTGRYPAGLLTATGDPIGTADLPYGTSGGTVTGIGTTSAAPPRHLSPPPAQHLRNAGRGGGGAVGRDYRTDGGRDSQPHSPSEGAFMSRPPNLRDGSAPYGAAATTGGSGRVHSSPARSPRPPAYDYPPGQSAWGHGGDLSRRTTPPPPHTQEPSPVPPPPSRELPPQGGRRSGGGGGSPSSEEGAVEEMDVDMDVDDGAYTGMPNLSSRPPPPPSRQDDMPPLPAVPPPGSPTGAKWSHDASWYHQQHHHYQHYHQHQHPHHHMYHNLYDERGGAAPVAPPLPPPPPQPDHDLLPPAPPPMPPPAPPPPRPVWPEGLYEQLRETFFDRIRWCCHASVLLEPRTAAAAVANAAASTALQEPQGTQEVAAAATTTATEAAAAEAVAVEAASTQPKQAPDEEPPRGPLTAVEAAALLEHDGRAVWRWLEGLHLGMDREFESVDLGSPDPEDVVPAPMPLPMPYSSGGVAGLAGGDDDDGGSPVPENLEPLPLTDECRVVPWTPDPYRPPVDLRVRQDDPGALQQPQQPPLLYLVDFPSDEKLWQPWHLMRPTAAAVPPPEAGGGGAAAGGHGSGGTSYGLEYSATERTTGRRDGAAVVSAAGWQQPEAGLFRFPTHKLNLVDGTLLCPDVKAMSLGELRELASGGGSRAPLWGCSVQRVADKLWLPLTQEPITADQLKWVDSVARLPAKPGGAGAANAATAASATAPIRVRQPQGQLLRQVLGASQTGRAAAAAAAASTQTHGSASHQSKLAALEASYARYSGNKSAAPGCTAGIGAPAAPGGGGGAAAASQQSVSLASVLAAAPVQGGAGGVPPPPPRRIAPSSASLPTSAAKAGSSLLDWLDRRSALVASPSVVRSGDPLGGTAAAAGTAAPAPQLPPPPPHVLAELRYTLYEHTHKYLLGRVLKPLLQRIGLLAPGD